jgi:hypothetical protein
VSALAPAWGLAAVATLSLLAAEAVAQTSGMPGGATRGDIMVVEPENPGEGASGQGGSLELEMRLADPRGVRPSATRSAARDDGQPVTEGDWLEVCLRSRDDGFITLWSYGSNGNPTLLYPNEVTHPGRKEAVEIRAGQRQCVGKKDKGNYLKVVGPAGNGRLSAVWTRTLEENVPGDAYVELVEGDPSKRVAQLQRSRSGSTVRAARQNSYRSTTLEYRVTEAE